MGYQSHASVALTLGKVPPIAKDKRGRPQYRYKTSVSAGTRNLDHPSPNLVTDLTKLSGPEQAQCLSTVTHLIYDCNEPYIFKVDSLVFNHLKTKRRMLYLTLRRLMSYIYGAPILDVSRSHATTQHSR